MHVNHSEILASKNSFAEKLTKFHAFVKNFQTTTQQVNSNTKAIFLWEKFIQVGEKTFDSPNNLLVSYGIVFPRVPRSRL